MTAALGSRDEGAIPVRQGGAQNPLFLLHGELSAARVAEKLALHLDASVPIYALPGVPRSASGPRTVEGMAKRCLRQIRGIQPTGPYRIAGLSDGGVLAYEVAVQMIGRDEQVDFLAIMDGPGPSEPGSRAGDDGATAATPSGVAGALGGLAGVLAAYSPPPMPIRVRLFISATAAAVELQREWELLLPDASFTVLLISGSASSVMEPACVSQLGRTVSRELSQIGATRRTITEFAHEPLVRLQAGRDDRSPLFCVPGAGASAVAFFELTGYLDAGVSVYGFEPRGLDGNLVPRSDVSVTARRYLQSLERSCPTGAIHLVGHSFGGWVALDMAQRLLDGGRRVESLTILDSDPPERVDEDHECDEDEIFHDFVETFRMMAGESLDLGGSLDRAGRLRALHESLRGQGLVPERSRHEMLVGPLRTFAACLRTTYRPKRIHEGRVHLVLAHDERLDAAQNLRDVAERSRWWRRWAPDLDVSVTAGNHVTMLKAPHAQHLASRLPDLILP